MVLCNLGIDYGKVRRDLSWSTKATNEKAVLIGIIYTGYFAEHFH